jgi:hypothetical protein
MVEPATVKTNSPGGAVPPGFRAALKVGVTPVLELIATFTGSGACAPVVYETLTAVGLADNVWAATGVALNSAATRNRQNLTARDPR